VPGKYKAEKGMHPCTDCEFGKKSELGDTGCQFPVTTPVPAAEPAAEESEISLSDVLVVIILSLPMSESDFTPETRNKFRQSIAHAAGVARSKVRIVKVEATTIRRSRHLLADGIKVVTEVAAEDSKAAKEVASNLTPGKINEQLEASGLPQANILESARLVTSEEGSDAGIIAGAVLGSLAAVGMAIAAYFYLSQRYQIQTNKPRQEQNIHSPSIDGQDNEPVISEYVNVAGAFFVETRLDENR
jgi:hypothetical protein